MVEVGELYCLKEASVEDYYNIKPHMLDLVGLKFLYSGRPLYFYKAHLFGRVEDISQRKDTIFFQVQRFALPPTYSSYFSVFN